MCEIYGVSSSNEMKINNDLEIFFSHSHKHCHGWGLATFGKEGTIIKEGIAAYKSDLLKKKLSRDILEKLAIAHIRYATTGETKKENAHPFVRKDILGTEWTLVHNGISTNGQVYKKYRKYAKGETDSETILIFLVNKINKEIIKNGSKKLSTVQVGDVLQKAIKDLSRLNNRINLLFTDGKRLYVHCNFKNSLYKRKEANAVTFATEPLDKDKLWEPVKINTLFIYKDGRLLYEGKAHNHEYFKPEITDKKLII